MKDMIFSGPRHSLNSAWTMTLTLIQLQSASHVKGACVRVCVLIPDVYVWVSYCNREVQHLDPKQEVKSDLFPRLRTELQYFERTNTAFTR